MSMNYVAIILNFFLIQSCQNTVQTNLKIKVIKDDKSPINQAKISMDDKVIGSTDTQGLFNYTYEANLGDPSKISITKQSDSQYYAPYNKTVTINAEDTQVIKILATLYSVPKQISITNKPDPKPPIEKNKDLIESKAGSKAATGNIKEVKEKVNKTTSEPSNLVQMQAKLPEQLPQTPKAPLINNNPKPEPPTKTTFNKNQQIFTILFKSKKKFIRDVEVYEARKDTGDLSPLCKSTPRGRCVIRFSPDLNSKKLIIKKSGYITRSMDLTLQHKKHRKIKLSRGTCLDIFTINKSYNHSRGIKGISVYVNDKLVGKTNRLGHFIYPVKHSLNSLIKVKLKSQRYLPKVYETSFVISKNMSLVRYFGSLKPPKIRYSLLKLRFSGPPSMSDTFKSLGLMNRKIENSIHKQFSSSSLFTKVPYSTLQRHIKEAMLLERDLLQQGWENTPLNGLVHSIIVPNIVRIEEKNFLELSVRSSNGQTIAAAIYEIGKHSNRLDISKSINHIQKKLCPTLPLEGSITKTLGQRSYLTNIRPSIQCPIRVGRIASIYGSKTSKYGNHKEHSAIAKAVISKTSPSNAIIKITSISARASISEGDQVQLMPLSSNYSEDTKKLHIEIKDSHPENHLNKIANANVYSNKIWIGSTNKDGQLIIGEKKVDMNSKLLMIKDGYNPQLVDLAAHNTQKTLRSQLDRTSVYLKINSEPTGAKVYINDGYVGTTPMQKPIKWIKSKVELSTFGPPGLKASKKIINMNQDLIELSAYKSIKLDSDDLGIAMRLIRSGNINKAINKLKSIPQHHNDYLSANQQLGKIYLNQLKNPKDAYRYLSVIYKNDQKNRFANKDYIAAHLLYAISSFKIGEEILDYSKKTALDRYHESYQVLQILKSFSKYFPEESKLDNLHSLSLYEALAMQRIASLTNDPKRIVQANRYWAQYLQDYKELPRPPDRKIEHGLTQAKSYRKLNQDRLNKIQKI